MADYHMDLGRLSLDWYQEGLAAKELMPGRRVLHDNLDQRFALIRGRGVETLGQLVEVLRTKPRLQRFAQRTGLEEEYLVILKRDAMSYIPAPVKLDRFPGVDAALVRSLANMGVKHSKHLFERIGDSRDLPALAAQARVDEAGLRALYELSDLVRVYGVGPVFAGIIHDEGIVSVEALGQCDPADLYAKLKERAQAVHGLASFTQGDIENCLAMTRLLPRGGRGDAV